jgi:hypothetical protein
MTESRKKGDISETVKKHLCDIYVRRVWGKEKDTFTKYTNKGIMVEEDSLTLFSRHQGGKLFVKNKDTLSNDCIQGTPDIVTKDEVIDIKSSWDAFTFKKASMALNDMYYWQLQGYMWLTGKKMARLAYCLINTPSVIVEGEKRKLYYQMGIIDDSDADAVNAFRELEENHTFDNIPMNERVIIWEIPFDQDAINRLQSRIEECRAWMDANLFKKVDLPVLESSGHESI